MAKIKNDLKVHADSIVKNACAVMTASLSQIQTQWTVSILACSSKDDVKAVVAKLDRGVMGWVTSQIEQSITDESSKAIKELETPLLQELRERYRIVQQITGSNKAIQIDGVVKSSRTATHAINFCSGVNSAIENFEGEQFAIGAGGVLAGAAIGTMVLPGIGTAIGAALGRAHRSF